MHNVAAQRDLRVLEEFSSRRHRAVVSASFAERPQPDVRAERAEQEAIEQLSLLAGALGPLAETTFDAAARAMAEDASDWFEAYRIVVLSMPSGAVPVGVAPVGVAGSEQEAEISTVLARLEDVLERIATTTTDEATRDFAEETLALYRGR
jgi:hypothetical protein